MVFCRPFIWYFVKGIGIDSNHKEKKSPYNRHSQYLTTESKEVEKMHCPFLAQLFLSPPSTEAEV